MQENTLLTEEEKKKIEEEEKLRTKIREKEKKKKQSKTAMGCLVVILLIVGFVILLVAFGGGGEKSSSPATQSSILGVGEEGILNNNSDKNDVSGVAILAVDEKAFDDFIQAQIADDKLGYSQMLGAGRFFVVDNGTAVKVIDTGFAKRKVRILEGEHLGKSGWIPYEFVVSK